MTDREIALGITQGDSPPEIVDLGPGYLDDALVPCDSISRWAADALRRWGPRALAYGANAGPLGFRAMLAARLPDPARAGHCTAANVLVTGGTSAALDQLAVSFARSGRVVLTESLTYDLGREIFEGSNVRVTAVPGPVDDIDTDRLLKAAKLAARTSAIPPAIYLIPTFHNPTGRVLSASRRREILAIASQTGALIVEDLAYSEISFGEPPPPPLWVSSEDREQVIGLYSFAKCLAPGLRLGWLVGGEHLVGQLAQSPVRVSGGGPNHFTSMAVMAGLRLGEFDEHVEGLRAQLRTRRDRLVSELVRDLPDGFSASPPDGGFFVWVTLPDGVEDAALLREAQRRGVSFAIGSRFGRSPGGVRLCFASCSPERLARGAGLFADACRSVTPKRSRPSPRVPGGRCP